MQTKLLIIFVLCFSYKLILNINNLVQIYCYKKLFHKFISKESNTVTQYKLQIIKLFENAGIKDVAFPMSNPVGYGLIAQGNASVFDNFPTANKNLALSTERMFENSIGVYKLRIIECFNPLYWINCIIFLPKSLLSYLGISAESLIIKIFQIIYWIISLLLAIFGSKIADWINSLV